MKLSMTVVVASLWMTLCSFTAAAAAAAAAASDINLETHEQQSSRLSDGVIALNHHGVKNQHVVDHVSPMMVAAPVSSNWPIHPNAAASSVPVVIAHGMGDSCFNPGMISITKAVGERTGSYSVCVGDGDDQASDTTNGFITNLYDAVDFFANKVQTDAHLKGGFNAMGFSQGNNVIRGYMEKYNDPPVLNFISVHGPLAGTGSLPRCPPSFPLVGKLCKLVTEMVAEAAYSDLVQRNVFQSNYLRDPLDIPKFKRKCTWLADMNGECSSSTQEQKLLASYKNNFLRTKGMLLVRAMQDTMIFPSMSEWFGAYEDGAYTRVLAMNETQWYTQDSFGLRTMFERGAISFDTTKGDHLGFSETELMKWVDQMFVV